MRGVLDQPAEAHLHQAELTLDHAEGVLDLGAHTGLALLALLHRRFGAPLGQLGDVARAGGDVPLQVLALHADLRAAVARVGPDRAFLAVQQVGDLLDVGLVGRGGGDRVHQTAGSVHRDVRLHAEVPLVALLGLVHFRVAFTLPVLGGTRRRDDGGVHDAALPEQQALALEVLVDGREDVLGEVALLEQVAKVQDRRLVGNRLAQAQPREGAQRGDLVQRLFHRRVAQRKPVLHQMHPQHRLQRVGAATSSGHRVVRLDQPEQRLPRHDHLHLFEEDLAPGLLPLAGVLRIRRADLAHRLRSLHCSTHLQRRRWTCSEFP